jgi:hypothetical protein
MIYWYRSKLRGDNLLPTERSKLKSAAGSSLFFAQLIRSEALQKGASLKGAKRPGPFPFEISARSDWQGPGFLRLDNSEI